VGLPPTIGPGSRLNLTAFFLSKFFFPISTIAINIKLIIVLVFIVI